MKDLTPEVLATLEALEEELWKEVTRFDASRMRELLAEDFTEIGMSGRRYSLDEILAVGKRPIGATLPLPDFNARLLTADVALVTYNSQVASEQGALYARRTSIWSRHDGSWKLRFHQGTPFSPE